MVNIIFNKGVGFTDVQDIITQENVAEMIIETDDKEALQTQLDNLCLNNDYLTALKILKNRIEREDL